MIGPRDDRMATYRLVVSAAIPLFGVHESTTLRFWLRLGPRGEPRDGPRFGGAVATAWGNRGSVELFVEAGSAVDWASPSRSPFGSNHGRLRACGVHTTGGHMTAALVHGL